MTGISITSIITFPIITIVPFCSTYYDRSIYTSHNKFNLYYKNVTNQFFMIGPPKPVIINLIIFTKMSLINLL